MESENQMQQIKYNKKNIKIMKLIIYFITKLTKYQNWNMTYYSSVCND